MTENTALTAVLSMTLKRVDNHELAALNIAVQGLGRVGKDKE